MAFASARDPIRFHLGRVLASLFPARLRHQESQFTRPENDAPAPGLTDRLIRYYLAHRTLGNPLALERMHRRFWEHQTPEDWYQLGATRHKTRHVPIFGPIISALGAPLMARDIGTVVEFGCGDGRWLAWLRDQWATVRNFHGVDLSASQIAANRLRYPDFQFEAGDLVAWAQAHARPHSLFLTQCGVLEYLSQESVDRLLQTLARRAPDSMVCFVEPIADDLDLSADDQPSTPHGDEYAWSHHYPARLRAAGLTVLDQQIRTMDGYRMLVIIGQTPAIWRPGLEWLDRLQSPVVDNGLNPAAAGSSRLRSDTESR